MGTVARSALLEGLFDLPVVGFAHVGQGAVADVLSQEFAFIARAASKRQADFAAGRLCAHAALAALGAAPGPVLRDAAGAPLWPPDIVGSITHTNGFCGAVVSARDHYESIGIDAERSGIPEEIWYEIFTPAERRCLAELPALNRATAATVMFCAKEAFYKCQYHLASEWVDFHSIEVVVTGPAFSVQLVTDLAIGRAGAVFTGRFAVRESVVVAGLGVSC
jgi:enterobactin synthetase component D / holo-[acyl-carrier protein] synthase